MNEKIIGIGHSKTGTSTLAACFREFGYRHTSQHLRLLEEVKRGYLQGSFDLADAYDSFEDWPWPLIYRQLDARYPNSKFILTVRKNTEVWLKSMKKHAERLGPTKNRSLVYGHPMPHGHEDAYASIYETHNREVLEYFKDRPSQLMVVCWENGTGWKELCEFLKQDIPNVPFPHSNKGPILSRSRLKRKLFFWITGKWKTDPGMN